jgi:hypothetical protein
MLMINQTGLYFAMNAKTKPMNIGKNNGMNIIVTACRGGENSMRYRIYFRHDDAGEVSVRELEAVGTIYRICDDHGRVVFGEPWPEKDPFINPLKVSREPSAY